MKRLILAFITWMLVGVTVTATWAAGPEKPVIEAEMPDCYSYIGGSGITLSVSYTHLDVYKRQILRCRYKKRVLRLADRVV